MLNSLSSSVGRPCWKNSVVCRLSRSRSLSPLRSAVCHCIHSAWQEIIACPPHSTSNKRAVLMRAFLRLSLTLSRSPSLSSLLCLSTKCSGSLFLLSLERVPHETAASASARASQVLATRGQLQLRLQPSRGVSVSRMVQAEWSSLTMGVSLTELGAFKHDDSYFRASRGGSLPTPPSPY